jgi:hypothetical protein
MSMLYNNFGMISFGTECLFVQEQMLVASNGHQSWWGKQSLRKDGQFKKYVFCLEKGR